jgi:tetratricopeptide (TPR) repeat protein
MIPEDSSREGGVPDLEFEVLVSKAFQKNMRGIREAELRERVYECIRDLASGVEFWKRRGARRIQSTNPGRQVLSTRVANTFRLVFEGPIETGRYENRVIFIHDFCKHDEYMRQLDRIAGEEIKDEMFTEHDIDVHECDEFTATLSEDTAAFAKPIPVEAFLGSDRIDAILRSEKANILMTLKQLEVLQAERPLLIHGHAGSGKTTILCHRLATSVLDRRVQKDKGSIAYISYNKRLVKQAETDTKEILRELHFVTDDLQGVDFVPFQEFLKRYVPNPEQFDPGKHVSFGRFKVHYDVLRRGDRAARKIPPELAWHGIRSILKGACVPPARPPLTKERYNQLARKRKELEPRIFEDIYRIGTWYQREVIRKGGLWDDQDLAWTALSWIMEEQSRNPSMGLYSEVFCDEVQDLTEIEFDALMSVCQPPARYAREGMPLALAGDPLQTINPTGFRWAVVSKEIFKVEEKPVRMHELAENFRSDKRIVAFANEIQKIRSFYLNQDLVEQESFEKDGDFPLVLTMETDNETSFFKDKLGDLPPESAVIVWDEDDTVVDELRENEEALGKIDHQLDLYKLSEAKGLEFRLVILYKFGSHPEVVKWVKYLKDRKRPSEEKEIPLLYFLNRLYVSVTRAKLFLIVVDTKEAIDDLWSLWPEPLSFLRRSDFDVELENHPSFVGDMSVEAWRKWADILLEKAERDGDIRNLRRSRRAYEKANLPRKVRMLDARIAEIQEEWEVAGRLYSENNDFELAGNCFERCEKWGQAVEAYDKLPARPSINRRIAVCTFLRDRSKDEKGSAREFFEYVQSDAELGRHIQKRHLQELAASLERTASPEFTSEVHQIIAENFDDLESYNKAARCHMELKCYGEAMRLFEKGGLKGSREYRLCEAENHLVDEEPLRAARIFHEFEEYDRVISISVDYEGRGIEPILADSYSGVGKYEMALEIYRNLEQRARAARNDSDRRKYLRKVGSSLRSLGENQEALEAFRESEDFDSAIAVAKEMKLPRAEIERLRIDKALGDEEYELAIRLAEGVGDENLALSIRGRVNLRRKKFREASEQFMRAEDWYHALECIDRGLESGEFSQGEFWNVNARFVSTLAKLDRELTDAEKGRFMKRIESVQEDVVWDQYIPREEMGIAYEKCAKHVEAALFYEANLSELWAQEGWLRVKEAQMSHHLDWGDTGKAGRIESRINKMRKKWSLE